jgi:hypothetical protein
MLLSKWPYQETVVPAIYFGALLFTTFWYLTVKRPGMAANNSFKPNSLRGSVEFNR